MLCATAPFYGVKPFKNPENLNRGRFRRIVTIGSPHNGSVLPYYISKLPGAIYGFLPFALRLGGVLQPKFDPFGEQIREINDPFRSIDPNARFHLIAATINGGAVSPGTNPLCYFLTGLTQPALIPTPLQPLRGNVVLPRGSDGVVDLDSQEGGTGSKTSLLGFDRSHSTPEELFGVDADRTETRDSFVADRVVSLLDGPASNFGPFMLPTLLDANRKTEIDFEVPQGILLDIVSSLIPDLTAKQATALAAFVNYSFRVSPPGSEPVAGAIGWYAEVYGSNGVTTAGVTVTVDATDATKVTVSVDDSVQGDVVLFASYGSSTGKMVIAKPVLVTSRPVGSILTGIEVQPASISARIGDKVLLEIWGVYDNGAKSLQFVSDAALAQFVSSNPSVATVDAANGLVSSISSGTTTITVTFNGLTAQADVTVPPITYIVAPSTGANGSISPDTLQNVISGGSVPFTATPNSGYIVDQWLENGTVKQSGGTSYIVSNVTALTTVQVTFKLSNNADLASLTPSAGTLTPAFTSGTTSYTESVPSATTTMSVTPTLADSAATVTVNGIAGISGSTSGPISLNVDSNTITVVVTAPDGVTTKTYTLIVTRFGTPEIAVEQPAGTGLVDGTGSRSFGSVAVGANRSLTFTIRNTGTSDLTGLGITIDGAAADAAMFSVTANPAKPVSFPSGSTTFTVRFTPTATGSKTAVLHIASNDLDESSFDITLTGNGVTDAAKPVLKLASPRAGQSVTGSVVVFRGRTTDDTKVERVEVALNGGPPQMVLNAGAPKDFDWTLQTQPENGVNTAVVTAYDEFNLPSLPITRTFTLVRQRPEFAGSYAGLATPVDAVGVTTPPARQVGLAKVTVGRTGRFSGKLTLGGSSVPVTLSATFGNGGNARFWVNRATASALEIKRKGLPPLFLALNLDVSAPLAQQITGTLTENGTVVSMLELNRALYTAGKIPAGSPLKHVPASVLNPLTDKGAYTCIFQAIAPPNEGLAAVGYPQGDGWALAKVKSSGAVTIAGKLADGQPVSFSGYLSQNNVLPLYLKLYAGTGTVSGPVSFRDVPGQSDADGVGLRWFKPGNPRDTAYRSGWLGGIKVDLLGSKFVSPLLTPLATRKTLLGNNPVPPATAPNAQFALSDGGLAGGLSNPLSVNVRNRVTVIYAQTGAPRLGVTLSGNGKFTGSFTHPPSGRRTTVAGVLLQKTQTGSGYFLGAPATGAPAGSPKQSGAVTISAQ
jgi:hypothetical protein